MKILHAVFYDMYTSVHACKIFWKSIGAIFIQIIIINNIVNEKIVFNEVFGE